MDSSIDEIKSLDIAIKNLIDLGKEFGDKFEFQTLGTVVQSTACFLTIAANTLDHGQRQLNFSDKGDWQNLISNINRFFYAHVHTAIEVELIEFCNRKKIKIESTVKRKLFEKYEKTLKQKIPTEHQKDIEDFLQENTSDRPSSMDFLNSSLKEISFSEDEKTYFRIFYEALSILRNKSSHSDPSLNDYESKKLKQAKLDFLISSQGTLQSQPGHYFHISKMVMIFLDNLC
jgi:hypothetical protein